MFVSVIYSFYVQLRVFVLVKCHVSFLQGSDFRIARSRAIHSFAFLIVMALNMSWIFLTCAFRPFEGSGSPETRSHAVRALANLAVATLNKSRISHTARALPVLVGILESDRGSGRGNAAAALGNLAHDHDENKGLIAQERGALPALVQALAVCMFVCASLSLMKFLISFQTLSMTFMRTRACCEGMR